MTVALDYSAGFPGAVNIRAKGYAGAFRYFGFSDRRKCTTAAELADFTAHERGMAAVFEDAAGNWRGGAAQGRRDGGIARGFADRIGFPGDRPIYAAVDQDVVTSSDFSAMLNYVGAFRDVVDVGGVYGESDVIDRCRDEGMATYFWQTAAWSRGRKTACNAFQYVGSVSVGGVTCDTNQLNALDWGQHNLEDIVTPQDIDAIAEAVWAKILANPKAGAQDDGSPWPNYSAADYLRYGNLAAWQAAEKPAVTVDAAAVAAELAAQGIGGVTEDQVRTIIRAAFTNAKFSY